MKRVLFRSFFHNLAAMGRLAVPGDGAGNESWTLELVAAEIPGGADAQGVSIPSLSHQLEVILF